MGKIENMLDPDERIIKSQPQVQLNSSAGTPYGTLSLTNKRLIFQVSRGWSLFSVVPAGALVGKDLVIPLREIKNVKKGWPSVLTVQAEKKYDFVIPSLQNGVWVDSIMQTCALSPPSTTPFQTQPRSQEPVRQPTQTQESRSFPQRFCGNCGSPLKTGNRFCVSCGAPIE